MIENLDETAEIQFVPICSKCHSLIHGEVNFSYSTAMALSRIASLKEYEITPYKCECCNRIFKTITMPNIFPYCYKDNL